MEGINFFIEDCFAKEKKILGKWWVKGDDFASQFHCESSHQSIHSSFLSFLRSKNKRRLRAWFSWASLFTSEKKRRVGRRWQRCRRASESRLRCYARPATLPSKRSDLVRLLTPILRWETIYLGEIWDLWCLLYSLSLSPSFFLKNSPIFLGDLIFVACFLVVFWSAYNRFYGQFWFFVANFVQLGLFLIHSLFKPCFLFFIF